MSADGTRMQLKDPTSMHVWSRYYAFCLQNVYHCVDLITKARNANVLLPWPTASMSFVGHSIASVIKQFAKTWPTSWNPNIFCRKFDVLLWLISHGSHMLRNWERSGACSWTRTERAQCHQEEICSYFSPQLQPNASVIVCVCDMWSERSGKIWQDEHYNMTIFWRKARPSSTHSRRSDRSTSQSKVGCCSNLDTKRLHLLLHKFRQIRQIRFGAIALQNAITSPRDEWSRRSCPRNGHQKQFPSYKLVSQDQRGPGPTWNSDCLGSSSDPELVQFMLYEFVDSYLFLRFNIDIHWPCYYINIYFFALWTKFWCFMVLHASSQDHFGAMKCPKEC